MGTIKRTTVTEQAIEEIKKYLMSGELKSGDKLATEAELSAMLGVGRSTVREAIRTLQAMGYVELRPGKGAFAKVTSEEEVLSLRDHAKDWFTVNERTLAEFLQVRHLVEPKAAELAAKYIDQAGIADLQKELDRFETAVNRKENSAELASADRQFHILIVRESKNQLLYQFYLQTNELFMQYSTRSFTLLNATAAKTLQEHKKILSAIKAGDADGARDAMTEHLNIAKDRMEVMKK